MLLSKTNLVLAFLLLFSVCLNFGLLQSFLDRPKAGERARALARSVNSQADELEMIRTGPRWLDGEIASRPVPDVGHTTPLRVLQRAAFGDFPGS